MVLCDNSSEMDSLGHKKIQRKNQLSIKDHGEKVVLNIVRITLQEEERRCP